MDISRVRVANSFIIAVFILANHTVYLWYVAAMHISLEILNRQPLYWQHSYKLYNFIFWIYELVLLERLRTYFFPVPTEWILNVAEHLFFGIIICLKIYIYTALFGKKINLSRKKRALIAFGVFNCIGLFNEVFQNDIAGRSLFVFIPDSIKDIQVNLLGAFVFAVAVWCRINWLKRNDHTGMA